MPLDPQVQKIVDSRAAAGVPPLYTLSLAEARQADLAAIQDGAGTPEAVRRTTDLTISGPGGPLPLRLYHPSDDAGLPVLLYFFGGGWTLGSIETSDAICRSLTNSTSCLTAAVGYRTAPEHPFPAAVEDCFAAVTWVSEQIGRYGGDTSRIAVGGDSAGGNLAAATSLLCRDGGGPALATQLLVYPNTEFRPEALEPPPGTTVDPRLFNELSVAWYWRNYLSRPEDGESPLCSPLKADRLDGLPPALVITAEYDPLRDEGERYAHRMRQAGVPVTLTRYDGMIHGLFTMGGDVDKARQALAQASGFLREQFTSR